MYRHMILAGLTLLAVGSMLYIGPVSQDLEYHNFADQLTLWAIPNFFNVASNIPFIFIGLWAYKRYPTKLAYQSYKRPYLVLSVGVILTAFGSGWYHLFPSNNTLVWDRLPMTIAFMSFFSLIIRDYVSGKWGQKILIPALLFGGFSILYWYLTEQMGAGDLRPYGLVQFLPMLLIPFIFVLYKPRYSSRFDLFLGLLFYLAAKGTEYFDAAIYNALGQNLSGHSLKHLLAAVGSFYILKMFLMSSKDSHYEPPARQD